MPKITNKIILIVGIHDRFVKLNIFGTFRIFYIVIIIDLIK